MKRLLLLGLLGLSGCYQDVQVGECVTDSFNHHFGGRLRDIRRIAKLTDQYVYYDIIDSNDNWYRYPGVVLRSVASWTDVIIDCPQQ